MSVTHLDTCIVSIPCLQTIQKQNVSQHTLFSCTITDTPSIAAEEEESDESQSALAFSHISLTEHQQNNQSTPIPVRENMKIANLSRQTAVSGVRVGANVAYEAQLLQDDQETVSFPPLSQPTITPHSKCTCCLLCVVWAEDEAQRTPSIVCVCMEARDNDGVHEE